MMADLIMIIGSYFFFILFAFLVFLFTVFLISLFKKNIKYENYSGLVSVLLPTYNEEKNIRKCINAIKKSTYKDYEIIVIDDGSKDSTLKILKDFKDVKVIKQEHKGKVDALNYGLKHSNGDLIITIDVDTFVEPNFITEMTKPFSDKNVGATSGAVLVSNKKSFSSMFQNLEYHQNNLIRQSFSKVFSTGIWFFGCLAAYRKSSLIEVGGFSKDTMAEDMDIAMEFKKNGYKTINVVKARGFTKVPLKLTELYNQRSRWWVGGLQSLIKHKSLFSTKSNPSILFLFINHFWWAFYAFISLPLFIYQINYWWPGGSFSEIFAYLFRWFSLSGPVYVLYKIPDWGLSLFNIFGVMSGIISVIMLSSAIILYKDKFNWRNIFVIFFYFPYTIILNLIMAASVIKFFNLNDKHFIRK